ncbi:21009_t:CDS:2, partial [Dentiscutata erythropus]
KHKRNISQYLEEKRKIRVKEERERREDINNGLALLQKELKLSATYYNRKFSNAALLKKAVSEIQIKRNGLTHLQEKVNSLRAKCIKFKTELDNVKM